MPRTRQEVAKEVYAAFLEAEEAAEKSAAAVARFTAILVEARGRAKLPPAVGTDVFVLLGRCTASALDARHHIVSAHPLLDQIAKEWNITGYGPDKEQVPNQPFVGATTPLRVVG